MKSILIATLFLLIISMGFSQSPIEAGHKFTINSEVFGEDREVWIGLPNYYDSTSSYPVVYVMDAEWQFDITLATVKELAANDKVPAHIVVGVPHMDIGRRIKDLTFTSNSIQTSGEEDSTLLAYFGEDLTGGGNKFYDHLVKEVLPFVEEKHLTNGFDVYIGHSLSGYYGAYLVSMDSPFNAFQLYDPSIWYDRGEAIKYTRKNLDTDYRTNVYIASADGGRMREQNNLDTHKEYHDYLKEVGINSELGIYDEDHGSVRLPALIDGLSKLYKGFSIGYIFPTDKITVEDAQKHYATFSDKVSYKFSCPPDAYRWIGHANHSQGKWEEAIKAFELCKGLFTDDPLFQSEAGESYFESGNLKESLKHYMILSELDSENESAKSKVKEITEKLGKK